MKLIAVVLICFGIVACSSTKVHLYSRYLSTTEIEIITKNLEGNNFEVVVNTLNFPSNIQESTLLYSPFIEGENTVNILIDTLDKIDWVIPTVQPLFSGNHYYTKNSVGLLLLPEGVMQSDKAAEHTLVNDYKSEGCDIDVELSIRKNGSYLLKYSEEYTNQTEHLEGEWRVTSYPYVELSSFNKEWYFYFEMQTNTKVDVVGKIEMVELKPVEKYKLLPNCSFVHGIRVT